MECFFWSGPLWTFDKILEWISSQLMVVWPFPWQVTAASEICHLFALVVSWCSQVWNDRALFFLYSKRSKRNVNINTIYTGRFFGNVFSWFQQIYKSAFDFNKCTFQVLLISTNVHFRKISLCSWCAFPKNRRTLRGDTITYDFKVGFDKCTFSKLIFKNERIFWFQEMYIFFAKN